MPLSSLDFARCCRELAVTCIKSGLHQRSPCPAHPRQPPLHQVPGTRHPRPLLQASGNGALEELPLPPPTLHGWTAEVCVVGCMYAYASVWQCSLMLCVCVCMCTHTHKHTYTHMHMHHQTRTTVNTHLHTHLHGQACCVSCFLCFAQLHVPRVRLEPPVHAPVGGQPAGEQRCSKVWGGPAHGTHGTQGCSQVWGGPAQRTQHTRAHRERMGPCPDPQWRNGVWHTPIC